MHYPPLPDGTHYALPDVEPDTSIDPLAADVATIREEPAGADPFMTLRAGLHDALERLIDKSLSDQVVKVYKETGKFDLQVPVRAIVELTLDF